MANQETKAQHDPTATTVQASRLLDARTLDNSSRDMVLEEYETRINTIKSGRNRLFSTDILSANINFRKKQNLQQSLKVEFNTALKQLSEERASIAAAFVDLLLAERAIANEPDASPERAKVLTSRHEDTKKMLNLSVGYPIDRNTTVQEFSGVSGDLSQKSIEEVINILHTRSIRALAADAVELTLAADGKLSKNDRALAENYRADLMDNADANVPTAEELIKVFNSRAQKVKTESGFKVSKRIEKLVAQRLNELDSGLETTPLKESTSDEGKLSLSVSPFGAATRFLGGAQFLSLKKRLFGKNEKQNSEKLTGLYAEAALQKDQVEQKQLSDAEKNFKEAVAFKTSLDKQAKEGQTIDPDLRKDVNDYADYASKRLSHLKLSSGKAPSASPDSNNPVEAISTITSEDAVSKALHHSVYLKAEREQLHLAEEKLRRFEIGLKVNAEGMVGISGAARPLPSAGVTFEFEKHTKQEKAVLEAKRDLFATRISALESSIRLETLQAYDTLNSAETLTATSGISNGSSRTTFSSLVSNAGLKVAKQEFEALTGISNVKTVSPARYDLFGPAYDSVQKSREILKDKNLVYWNAVEELVKKNPKSEFLHLDTNQILLPALGLAEAARFGVMHLVNRFRHGPSKETLALVAKKKEHANDGFDSESYLSDRFARTASGSNERSSKKAIFSTSALLGLGALAIAKHNPGMTSELLMNMGGSSAATTISAALRHKPIVENAVKGALGGQLMFLGEQLATDLMQVPGGGFVASGVQALGVSSVRNTVMGRGFMDRLEVPFGPIIFGFDKATDGTYKPQLSFSMQPVLGLALAFGTGAKFDFANTMRAATPVFKKDLGDLSRRLAGEEVDSALYGTAFSNIITLDENIAKLYGKKEEHVVLGHERVHAFQYSKWSIAGEPLAKYLDLGLVGPEKFRSNTAMGLGGALQAVTGFLSTAAGGYRGNIHEQEAFSWEDYTAQRLSRPGALSLTAIPAVGLDILDPKARVNPGLLRLPKHNSEAPISHALQTLRFVK